VWTIKGVASATPFLLEKVACGAFSDASFVAGRKRRDFCGLCFRVATPGRRLD
jgi:hypothetical protein